VRGWWIAFGLLLLVAILRVPLVRDVRVRGCAVGGRQHGWRLYFQEDGRQQAAELTLDQSKGCWGCGLLGEREGKVEVEGTLYRRLWAFGIRNNSHPVIGFGYGRQNGGYLDTQIVLRRITRLVHDEAHNACTTGF
jgi:hypothetical protein